MIKAKLAALLRSWAYALHPKTAATLPDGYEVKKITASFNFKQDEIAGLRPGEKFRAIPDALTGARIRAILIDDLIAKLRKNPECFTVRADIAPIPGGLVEYDATLFVGANVMLRKVWDSRRAAKKAHTKMHNNQHT